MAVAFVTGNNKKWEEVQAILGDAVPLVREDIDLPELQGSSIEYIARQKAIYAADRLRMPVVIEDTALCFNALNGLPGPYIKWFLDALGHVSLNKLLAGFDDKSANAVCTLAYCQGPGHAPLIFQGVTAGTIVMPRGPPSFGWDPIFQPDHPASLTYAEMTLDQKNAISHRYRALQKLRDHFQSPNQQ